MVRATHKEAPRVAIYARVSTNEQNVENQLLELRAVAERRGWRVVGEFIDRGISGAKGRDKRLGLDRLLKAVTRREVTVVAAWSVDRLGRSLQHLVETLGDLKACGCELYQHKQGLDTSTPSGKAMYQMLGVFAEFEREMIRERVTAGMARAKASGKRIGRPTVDESVERRIIAARRKGIGMISIARSVGCGVSTVQRVVGSAAAS